MLYKEMPYPIVREGRHCPVDLYVKIRNDYRLFAARGALITREHCRIFSRSKATLYIRSSDNESAEAFLKSLLTDLLTDSHLEPEVKANIIYASSMKSIRQVFQGLNHKTLKDIEKTSEFVVKLILSDKRVMSELVKVTGHDHFTYHHSVKVGIYGTSLAVQLFGDRSGDHNLQALSTALFLHDIGLTRVPRKILEKREPLNDMEHQVVMKHPVWGHDRLMNANYLTSQAASVVLFHHEWCNGKGYPFGKTREDIPLYARICAIADTFETLTSSTPSSGPLTPFEALTVMQQDMAGSFDSRLFRAFVEMLGSG